ncbi:hypothetical protein BFP78_00135 [Gaetbulibacter sp. 5U11]|nr:hypothetical protein BFP78_00135 [Gaetbulibacter sp. 5U11]
MDLTKVKNQIEVAKNWYDYKDKIVIPNWLRKKIELIIKDYDNFMITNNEVSNQILDLLNNHFKLKN